MRVTVFTGNQPRHLRLIERLAEVADRVFAVQECNTVFPGQVQGFYAHTPVMREYFSRVIAAEKKVFGRPRFLPGNVSQLALQMGDASRLELNALDSALHSSVYLVFGASYLKGALADFLIARRCYNIHMGVSPQYRGSSCNFWALYDGRPGMVGATIHLLSKGLDSGPMLFHALPPAEEAEPFEVGMRAVRAAQNAFAEALRSGELQGLSPVDQDRGRELRYSRHRDFTDEVASEYLGRLPSPSQVAAALGQRDLGEFVRPRLPAS